MFILGVAGGSGSGKTTFANKIMQRVNHPEVVLLHQDSYYQASPPQGHRVHGEPNFDHPEAFDWPLLRAHLAALKAGNEVETPIYDFKTSRRLAETRAIGPCQVLLFEGIYALWDEEIRSLMDLRVYLHVDADIRFIRRLHRDVRERSRTLDSIIRQYYDTVRPMHRQFLEPTQQYADLSVGEETDLAADVLAAQLRERVGFGVKKDVSP